MSKKLRRPISPQPFRGGLLDLAVLAGFALALFVLAVHILARRVD
jgi:hypothetical protein